MKTLNIKLNGTQYLNNAIVYVDNKQVKFKQNEFKNLVSKVETDSDKVTIKVYKALDVGGVVWFITQLFFFLISIFGIFDVYTKNRYLALCFECDVNLKDENNITLSCKKPVNNEKAFEVETDLIVSELENKFYIDEAAKKKLKWLLISKIILAVAIVATVIIVLVTK